LITPKTVYINSPIKLNYLIDKIGGYPFVVKQIFGSGYSGVALMKDKQSAISTIQSLLKAKTSIILQE
jgi:glutathione synthase/RimK-type ligase-like ATP-grasp enzyme